MPCAEGCCWIPNPRSTSPWGIWELPLGCWKTFWLNLISILHMLKLSLLQSICKDPNDPGRTTIVSRANSCCAPLQGEEAQDAHQLCQFLVLCKDLAGVIGTFQTAACCTEHTYQNHQRSHPSNWEPLSSNIKLRVSSSPPQEVHPRPEPQLALGLDKSQPHSPPSQTSDWSPASPCCASSTAAARTRPHMKNPLAETPFAYVCARVISSTTFSGRKNSASKSRCQSEIGSKLVNLTATTSSICSPRGLNCQWRSLSIDKASVEIWTLITNTSIPQRKHPCIGTWIAKEWFHRLEMSRDGLPRIQNTQCLWQLAVTVHPPSSSVDIMSNWLTFNHPHMRSIWRNKLSHPQSTLWPLKSHQTNCWIAGRWGWGRTAMHQTTQCHAKLNRSNCKLLMAGLNLGNWHLAISSGFAPTWCNLCWMLDTPSMQKELLRTWLWFWEHRHRGCEAVPKPRSRLSLAFGEAPSTANCSECLKDLQTIQLARLLTTGNACNILLKSHWAGTVLLHVNVGQVCAIWRIWTTQPLPERNAKPVQPDWSSDDVALPNFLRHWAVFGRFTKPCATTLIGFSERLRCLTCSCCSLLDRSTQNSWIHGSLQKSRLNQMQMLLLGAHGDKQCKMKCQTARKPCESTGHQMQEIHLLSKVKMLQRSTNPEI